MRVRDPLEAVPENPLDESGEAEVYRALRHFWHPVLYAAELGEAPQRVILLDEALVIVRLGGEVRCFPDLCVHRGTALSLGWVEGDELRCAYHGWTYGPDGVCTSIPARHGASIPSRARLRRINVQERQGLIWVCLSEEPKYPAPDFPEWDEDAFRVATVPSYDWECSATRRVENYVDFAHFAWLHDGLLASRDQPEVPDVPVWREDGILRFTGARTEPAGTSDVKATDADGPVASTTNYRLFMPFTVWLRQSYEDGKEFVLFMAASPVGRKRVRSFTFNARNYALDQDDDQFIAFQELIVSQDRPVAESQRPEELPMDLSAELHIRGVDRISLEYRKWLVELKALGSTDKPT